MTSNKDKFFAYGLTIILLLLGIVGYAAFPEKGPDVPNRILFPCMAGKVQFNHQGHADGYGLGCMECHHNLSEGETNPESCGTCHEPESEDPIKRSDAFHKQCIGCHEGGGPTECKGCHMM